MMNADRQRPSCPGVVRHSGPPTRRAMLRAAANGFGYLALSALMADRASADPTTRRGPHFPPRAKNVIFCFMDGGVSHVDSFDPKPKLAELDGKAVGRVDNPDGERQPQVAQEPVEVPPARPVGTAGQRAVPAHRRRAPTTGRHPLDEGRPAAALDGRPVPAHRQQQRRPAEPRLVGRTTAWAARTRTCPASSCSASASCPAAAWRTSPAASCRPITRRRSSQADGTPIDNIVPADDDRRIQRAKLDLLARAGSGASRRSLGR